MRTSSAWRGERGAAVPSACAARAPAATRAAPVPPRLTAPPNPHHSTRGSLVIVANSKKTDINKQGLNSIKARGGRWGAVLARRPPARARASRRQCVRACPGVRPARGRGPLGPRPARGRPPYPARPKTRRHACGRPPTPLPPTPSPQNDVVKATLMGVSRKMKDKNWTDSQGRKGKGYGVYRFADKYGANVDGYSPIYTPDTWSESGETYKLGTKGLVAWAGLIAVLLAVGASLIVSTSQIGQ